MEIERVVSGGQTGADQAGLRAARACGIATGGWAPAGWETEGGPAPWLADFGLVECPEPGYPARTRRNVFDSSATIWFGSLTSPGAIATHRACLDYGRSIMNVMDGKDRPSDVVRWLGISGFRVLNVAGNRESTAPGIGARVERFMLAVFGQLGRG